MAKQVKKGKSGKSSKGLARGRSGPGNIVCLLIIVAFTFVLYGNSIQHDYALDDNIVTRLNGYVQKGVNGIPDIFSHGFLMGFNKINDRFSPYRPLALANFAIEKQIFGNDPGAHHFFNVLYYAIAIIVLFFFLQKIFPAADNLFVLIASLLFAAMPVHTEVVANIKSRDEILCFIFSILSLSLLMDYIQFKKITTLILMLLCYFLALLAKENALTLLAIVPLLVYFFTKTQWMQNAKLTLLFAAMAGLYMLIRFIVLEDVKTTLPLDIINNTLMAAPSLSQRYATISEIFGKYLQLLFFPIRLSSDYSYHQIPIVSWLDWEAWLPLLIAIALLGTAGFLFIRKNPVAFAILFFFISLSMVLNIFMMIGATMAERFLFTPSLAFAIAIPFLLSLVFRDDIKKISWDTSRGFIIIAGVILILFSFKTHDRNNDWQNNFSLFTAGLKSAPNSASMHFSIASEYRTQAEDASVNPVDRQKLLRLSVQENRNALTIYPRFAQAWYNLGVTYYDENQLDSAAQAYRNTVKYDPNYHDAWNNLGVYYIKKARYDSAIVVYEKLLKEDSTVADTYANLGAVYHNLSNYPKAVYYYRKALNLNPNNSSALENLQKIKNINPDLVK